MDKKDREKFLHVVNLEDYCNLEYQDKNFSVFKPVDPDDLIEEGATLNHCVGSYIRRVINGETKIVFMRNSLEPKIPLVTLDVRNGILFQAAGFGNRSVNTEERTFIKKWCEVKNIDSCF